MYPSVRFIVGYYILAGEANTDLAKAVIEIIDKQFPKAKVTLSPKEVYKKISGIAWKQKVDETGIGDVVQDFLRYLIESKHSYKKAAKTGDQALYLLMHNLSGRFNSFAKAKKTRSKFVPSSDEYELDDESSKKEYLEKLGPALDDQVAIKQFMDLLDEELIDLEAVLPEDQKALFDIIFNENVGSFSTDIKQNMGQSTSLKEKYPLLYEKNAKRWSGFVGDLRKKLLQSIEDFFQEKSLDETWDAMKRFFHDGSGLEA